jgi:hypothetical protein
MRRLKNHSAILCGALALIFTVASLQSMALAGPTKCDVLCLADACWKTQNGCLLFTQSYVDPNLFYSQSGQYTPSNSIQVTAQDVPNCNDGCNPPDGMHNVPSSGCGGTSTGNTKMYVSYFCDPP